MILVQRVLWDGERIKKQGTTIPTRSRMSEQGQLRMGVSIRTLAALCDEKTFAEVHRRLPHTIRTELHSSPTTTTSITDLKIVKFCFEGLDRSVSQLEVFVQAIALRYQLHRRRSFSNPIT